jgi:drug/metabolite transporter (DMT)-like permease
LVTHSAAAVSGISVGVTFAVLGAATLHAGWNAAAHRVTDRLVGFVLIGATCSVCALVLLPFVASPARAAWPFIAASFVTHIAYNLLLMRSYELGDFNQMYPLARGTSPLVVAVAAAVFIGEDLPPVHLLGVIVISVGLMTLVGAGGRPGRRELPALSAAVITGLAIATYTVLDGVGVRRSGSVGGYVAWLFLLQGLPMPIGAFALRGGRVMLNRMRGLLWIGVLSGAASFAAYAIVIWAQTQAPLATVAALREVSIVVGAILGALLFHERFGKWRVVGSALAVIGIALLEL